MVRPSGRTVRPWPGYEQMCNLFARKDLGALAWYGTARAPSKAMKYRFGSMAFPFWARFTLPAVVGLILSASVAEAQRPVPVKPQTQQSQARRDPVVPPGFFRRLGCVGSGSMTFPPLNSPRQPIAHRR